MARRRSNAEETDSTPKRVMTLKEALTLAHRLRWKGTNGEKGAMINATDVCETLGMDRPVDSVTTEDVDELVFELEDRELALSTINKKLSALSTVLGVASDRGHIKNLPKLAFRKVYNGRIRWFSENEEEQILYLCNQWGRSGFADLFTVAADLGMRQSELLRMEARDYNHETRMASAWVNKNDDPRSIPATGRVHDILVRLSEGKAPTERLFVGMDKWRIRTLWDRIRRHLNITEDKQFVFHTFRHTCASRMAMEGVPLMLIQKYLGHRSIQTTLRYAHLSPETLGQARDALEKRQERFAKQEEQKLAA